MGDGPAVSVVIASSSDASVLDACLSFLLPACREHSVEIVVARGVGAGELRQLEESYPGVHIVGGTPGSTSSELRAAGMAVAEGDIVLLTEDHQVVSRAGVRRLLQPVLRGRDWPGQTEDGLQEVPGVDWRAYFAQHGLLTEDADHPFPGAGSGVGE